MAARQESLERLQQSAARRFEKLFLTWRERFAPGLEMEIARGVAWHFFTLGAGFAAEDLNDKLSELSDELHLWGGLKFPETPPAPGRKERSGGIGGGGAHDSLNDGASTGSD